MKRSPVGTAEHRWNISAVPTGLSAVVRPGFPALKRWAIITKSLRDRELRKPTRERSLPRVRLRRGHVCSYRTGMAALPLAMAPGVWQPSCGRSRSSTCPTRLNRDRQGAANPRRDREGACKPQGRRIGCLFKRRSAVTRHGNTGCHPQAQGAGMSSRTGRTWPSCAWPRHPA